jgi:fucose permease
LANSLQRHYALVALGIITTVGLWDGSRGVILPHFLTDLDLTAATGAAIFSSGALGFLACSLTFGYLTRRFGLKQVATGGFLLFATALALFFTQREPLFLTIAVMAMGAGMGMVELSSGIPISMLYGEKQHGMLNLLHGFFGLGALSGSLLAALFLGYGASWRAPYILALGLLVVWTLIFRRLPTLTLPQPPKSKAGMGPMLRDPLVWIATLTLSAAVAAEVGVGLWLPSYLQQEKGLGEAVSAFGLTIFFMGFTATRLLASWLVNAIGPVRSVMGLGLIGVVGLTALLLLPGAWYALAALAGAGVAIAFATCVALVATRYPERVNQVYAFMYSCGAVTVMVTGPLMGLVGQRVGLGMAMLIPLTAYVAIILLIMLYGWAEIRVALRPVDGQST